MQKYEENGYCKKMMPDTGYPMPDDRSASTAPLQKNYLLHIRISLNTFIPGMFISILSVMRTLAFFSALLLASTGAFCQQSDWSSVESVFGKQGVVQDNVFKITFPRYDLNVKVGDFTVSPLLALTTWVGLMNMGGQARMMGDMVVTDQEESAAIQKLLSEGLEVTAIHNHLLNESPAVKYIHFSGSGNPAELATKIRSVLEVTQTPMKPAKVQAAGINTDWSAVERILGQSGKRNGVLLQYAFPRQETLAEGGMTMPAAMGMATVINFQMDNSRAAVAGDFVLLADEVNPVVKTLTSHGIAVTALHNHMLYDNPRLFMVHFWAVGDPSALANGLKAALEQTKHTK